VTRNVTDIQPHIARNNNTLKSYSPVTISSSSKQRDYNRFNNILKAYIFYLNNEFNIIHN
jgi:methionine synthase II (cobalamin-independent)